MSARFVPARVPLVDPRTGLMTREWYLFFQNLMDPTLTDAADQAFLFATGGTLALGSDGEGTDDPTILAMATPAAEPADQLASPHVPADLVKDELITILGYTPANKAGETFTGPITAPTITSTGNSTAATLITTGGITAGSLGVYPDDAAAGAGGLTHGMMYQTATGEMRIKL